MRVGYLGPQGSHSHQALIESGASGEPLPLDTLYDTVMAVQEGAVELALVPIENSIEGSVDVTLDTLAGDARDVAIVGERVAEIRNCLIAAAPLELERIESVHSHPQASAQCAHFLRTRLPGATVIPSSSTAEAVRSVTAQRELPHAALGNRLAASLYGGEILVADVDDHAGNQTRFVWLARAQAPGEQAELIGAASGPAKCSIVFWGAGDGSAGWLVGCLGELAQRGVSLTRIESRPRRIGLGHYMFFADFVGGAQEPGVAAAIEGLRARCEEVRLLGSYRSA